MNRLLDLFRLIPGTGKVLAVLFIVVTALAACFMAFGLVPTVVLAVCFLAIYAGMFLYSRMVARRERQQGLAFGKAIGGEVGPSREEVRHKVAELNQNWQTALEVFKNHNVDLYKLPWYLLIGEPQSGKSSTLRSSSLSFPLGEVAYSGTGGTKNCDWWFTSEGVVLDTAGRFTTQTGATDAHEWDRFLDLLVRYRPYCPVNGVIVVIPADALLREDRAAIERNAQALSDRLAQVQRRLAICFPVYVMVTKCDLIYGFTQFFDQLPPNQQVEMFGWSNPETAPGYDSQAFDRAFEEMLARIHHTRLKSLSQAHAITPEKTYVFPEEFGALKAPLETYLRSIFKGDIFREPLLFRGFYFSSALQEGHPIVKACGEMIRDSSILQNLKELFQTPRSFFVRDFYSGKVFPEEGLISRGAQFRTQDRRKSRLLLGVNIALVVMGLTFAWFMWHTMTSRLRKPQAAVEQASKSLDQLEGDFFEHPREVYKILADLKTGVGAAHADGFNFFKGKRNALTESMDDTFAVLYLDRVLLGMFERVAAQLREFKVEKPLQPVSSKRNLDALCDAMANLEKWRVAVERKDFDRLEPQIEPFLALTLDPQWDEELADLRNTVPLAQSLGDWFREVYAQSSEEVRQFLITEMVERAQNPDTYFKGLDYQVERFYKEQPELIAYRRKLEALAHLAEDWVELGREPATIGDYNAVLDRFAVNFGDEMRRRMDKSDDNYLPFEEIRRRVVQAMGDDFKNLDSGKNLDPTMVSFARALADYQVAEGDDPRAGRKGPEGKPLEGSIDFPAYAIQYWEKIVDPYLKGREMTEAANSALADGGLGARIDALLTASEKRIKERRELWETQLTTATEAMPAEAEPSRIGAAGGSFLQLLLREEREQILAQLDEMIAGEPDGVPSPPSKWRDYCARLDAYERDDFQDLLELPQKVLDVLRPKVNQLDLLFGRLSPDQTYGAYVKDARAALGSLNSAVQDLRNTDERTLAKDTKVFQREQFRKLDRIKSSVPPAFASHYAKLRRWADAGAHLSRDTIVNAEPCPDCGTQYKSLVGAVTRVGNGFPIQFNGQTRTQRVGVGQVEVDATLAKPEDLDNLFKIIAGFRNLSKDQEDYLQKRGKLEAVRAAIAWAEPVEKLVKGELTMEYKIDYSGKLGEKVKGKDIGNIFTFVTMEGGYEAGRMSLNSPRFTQIKRSESTKETCHIRFKNEANTGASRDRDNDSIVTFNQGFRCMLAWAFDGSSTTDRPDQRQKILLLPLDRSNEEEVKALFQFKTSEPLPPPPDWNKLKEP